MTHLTNRELIEKARKVLAPRELYLGNRAGDVSCALLSSEGNLYLGVCLDIGSGIGFCAEHNCHCRHANRRGIGHRHDSGNLGGWQSVTTVWQM